MYSHVREKGLTAFRGDVDKLYTFTELREAHSAKLIQAFLADDDIQEITIISANFGIVLTYTKLSPDSASRLIVEEKATAH